MSSEFDCWVTPRIAVRCVAVGADDVAGAARGPGRRRITRRMREGRWWHDGSDGGARRSPLPSRVSGPTEGVMSCGHFAVSGAAVGDRPCGVDAGRELKPGPAVVAILFGFFLASTGMADDIQ